MTRDEQALGILEPAPVFTLPVPAVRERPGSELVPLVHGRVIASTRGYTTQRVPDPSATYGVRIERTEVEEHLVDEPGRRQLLCMRLSRSLGARGKGTSPGRLP